MNNEKPFEIIVLGPPVSGKGTQAELVAKTFAIPHVSTGQILHLIKDDTGNVLSAEVAQFMNAGKLVPDELVNQLVLERIKQNDCAIGFVLDGYPRTIEQAEVINGATSLDYVFLIDVKDETVVERITGRRVCRHGHTWHVKYSPTKIAGVCDTCGDALFQRDDDKPEVVKERLSIYHQNMDPIIKFYADKNILIKIDGEVHIEGVFQQIVREMVHNLRNKVI